MNIKTDGYQLFMVGHLLRKVLPKEYLNPPLTPYLGGLIWIHFSLEPGAMYCYIQGV